MTIRGMETENVIAAGVAGQPVGIGGSGQGTDPGTWVADGRLGPGTTYRVDTYSPRPSAPELATAGRGYPGLLLTNYLTLMIPVTGVPAGVTPQVEFPLFHAGGTRRLLRAQPGAKRHRHRPPLAVRRGLRAGPAAGGARGDSVRVRGQPWSGTWPTASPTTRTRP